MHDGSVPAPAPTTRPSIERREEFLYALRPALRAAASAAVLGRQTHSP
jgi:hypothetical protein